MSERPFMQLYVSDFVGDTLQLSTEQIGAYFLMLIALWNAGGSLPAGEVELARISRMSVKKWRAVSPELLTFFTLDNEILSHARLSKELQKVEAKRLLRAAAGARGGIATALKNKRTPPAFAAAKHTARLQHLPEPYKKEGKIGLEVGDLVQLDRWAEEALFTACEAVMGTHIPDYQQVKSFPASIVAAAKKRLSATAK
ncbi:Uncharacterized conserved protein YdaU, DUF1376 family [Devosia sp. YR412]|uniref:DUF1376 domain-containing protein n=1 Tax=Devosia sp. YR412 TaxID=1881030 RepID=UPI0008C27F00|nr:DUF1376 domain-containing protein [Devosia sp. YR412]SEP63616.1 Uncharacterized conserved protein YdaU, DUF1376 family [Devosia sp. YR412]